MQFQKLDPEGPVLLIPEIFGDDRGFFMETFRQKDFEEHCGNYVFVQDNQSRSSRNVLRGMHYQLKHPQGKLVRVISGSVFDALVDLRKSSPNFGKSYGIVLDSVSHHSLWVPPGFAHGFLVLSDSAEFVYKCTDYYNPADECCLLWSDPQINIDWPLDGVEPVLSAKDKKGALFCNANVYP